MLTRPALHADAKNSITSQHQSSEGKRLTQKTLKLFLV